MKVNRTDRLNGEIMKAVYEIISKKLKNPDITAMVSVTKVDCAPDLKNAKVWISVYSSDKEKENKTFLAVKDSAKQIRYELARMLTVRTVPELHIVRDESMEYSARIDKLLGGLNITPEETED